MVDAGVHLTEEDESGGGGVGASLGWALSGAAANQALQFAIFVALARLLDATTFGLAVEASLVIDVLAALSTAGVPAALVRAPSVDDVQASTGFWIHLALGTLGWLLAAAASPLVAGLFHQPMIAPLLIVLGLNLVIAPLGAVHVALIERDLGFRTLSVRTFGANLAGGLVGLSGALLGLGAWALVLRSLAAAVTTVIVVWIAHPFRPRARFDLSSGRALLGQGAKLAGSELIGQLNARGLELLAGLLISPSSVGVLRIAGRLFGLLSQLTLGPLSLVALPTLAKAQSDRRVRTIAYRNLAALAAIVVLPVFIGAAAVADIAVPLVFGSKWSLSGLVTPGLCALVVPLLFNVLFWAALAAAGHASTTLKWNALQLVIGLPLAAVAARFGLPALIFVTIARSYAMLPLGQHILFKRLGLAAGETWRPMARPALCAVLMGALVFLSSRILLTRLSPATSLVVLVAEGATIYAALLSVLAPQMSQDLWGQAERRIRQTVRRS